MKVERRRFHADGSVILGLRVGAARATLWLRGGERAFAKAHLDIAPVHLSAGARRNVHLVDAERRPEPRLAVRFEASAGLRRWLLGVPELIDMRPFGLFLERPHTFARRG